MKTLFKGSLMILLAWIVNQPLIAMPLDAGGEPLSENAQLRQQISRYLTYPQLLRGQDSGRVVAISFWLDDEGQITKVRVHTRNEALNQHITSCLQGRKLRLPKTANTGSHTEYRLRLHFQSI